MQKQELPKDARKRIGKAVNHVLKDLQGDLSLESLAGIASYSPYHFQRLFKQVMGESPKQYVIRMRLETAAHYLLIHKHKPIQVIALDCGFSSPAVFARAYKNYFGITAEEFRGLKQIDRATFRKKQGHLKKILDQEENRHHPVFPPSKKKLQITVKQLPVQYGICINTSFESADEIERTIREIAVQAKAHDLLQPGTKIMGIIYPHHNIYRAFIPVDREVKVPVNFNSIELRAGKFAVFKVKGSLHEIFGELGQFYNVWLPENGYKLADVYGFETFSEDPLKKKYHLIEREIFVPIEPAG